MKRSRIPLLVGMGVALLAGAILLLVDTLRQGLYQETLRREVGGQVSDLRARLEAGINARLQVSQGLVTHVSIHPDISPAEFEAFARDLSQSESEIAVVALVHGTTIVAIYPHPPPAARGVIGVDLMQIPAQREAVLQAQRTRRAVLAGPVDLLEGGQSLILRIPVMQTGKDLRPTGQYWGMISLLIDPHEFCAGALESEVGHPLQVAIAHDGGGAPETRQFFGKAEVWRNTPVMTDVHLPGTTWQLAAVPIGGWQETAPETWLWRVGGALIAILAGVLAGLRSAQPERLRQAVAQATAQLQSSEEQLRLMFESSPDFVLMLNPQAKILFANRTLSGLPASSLVGQSLYDYMGGAEGVKLRDNLDRCCSRLETVTFESRYVDPQGQTHWYRNRLVPVQRTDQPLSALAISTDITSRMQSEQELRDSEERFRRAFHESPLGLVMLALDMKILRANESFCNLLGYTAEEIVQIDLAAISPPEEFEKDRQNIAWSLEQPTGGVVRRVKRYLRKDGASVWCNLTGTVMRDPQGQPMYMLGMLEDITSRREAETKLAAAEERNRAMLNAIPDIIQRVHRSGRYLDYKIGGEQARFVDPEVAISKTVYDFFPPETAKRFMGVVEATLATGKLTQFEITLEKDGVPLDYDVRVAVCGEDEVLVLVRNITDQKRARQVLHSIVEGTSHAVGADFLRELVRILAHTLRVRFGFISEFLDAQGVQARMEVFWADDRFLEPFDYPRQSTPCERVADKNPVHVPTGLQAQFPHAERLHRLGADSYLAVPLHDQEGAICGVMGIMHDQPFTPETTALSVVQIFAIRASAELQRKRVEAALRESEERFRRLSEASFEGLVIHENGVVLDANQVFATMFGYTVDEVIGKKILDFAAPESRAEVRRRIEAGDERPYEADGLRRDGTRFSGELLPREIPLHGRRVRVTALRDITDRKRSEAEKHALELQVQHAQKLESLGLMAGGIAHDFNNLLTGILGHASLAQLDLTADGPTRTAIQQIELAARRAADLTNQLLAYSGKGRFVVQAVDLSRLVREMAQLLEVSIPKKITLEYDFQPDLHPIEGDATQIQQVVMNLITNAADAIGAQAGTIKIRTGRMTIDAGYVSESFLDKQLVPGDYAFLEVADTGVGMNEATLARMFDPFFTTKFTGRGLGLAAVLGIVRGHRGALKVQSRPGMGTIFRVLLPFAARVEAVAPAKVKTDRFFIGQGTVLVVDDEESVRTVARLMLQKFGFRVLIARDGKEGVEVFTRHAAEINVVLLDMTMPQMSGEEAFREMAQIRPEVAVILSSGYSEPEAVSRFGASGLAGFIQKPYRTMELIQAVQTALNRV